MTDVPSCNTQSNQLLIPISYKKRLHLPTAHPKRNSIENSLILHKIKSHSIFREQGWIISLSPYPPAKPHTFPTKIHFPESWKQSKETGQCSPPRHQSRPVSTKSLTQESPCWDSYLPSWLLHRVAPVIADQLQSSQEACKTGLLPSRAAHVYTCSMRRRREQ